MLDILVLVAWVVGIILGIMWLFLPWIIVSKLDQVIAELREIKGRKA